jgi:asparagine synthase (glutamine-hydrolysing)
MCGIFALLGKTSHDIKKIDDASLLGRNRGPEYSTLTVLEKNVFLGFHRLAINGLNSHSNQPLKRNDLYLICNGEIYNYVRLYDEMGIVPETDSDCEVILHVYERFGIEGVLQMIDGVFAFILVDLKNEKIYTARDAYGVRPMFIMENKQGVVAFASEMKQLIPLSSENSEIRQYKPGSYSMFHYNNEQWIFSLKEERFANFPFMRRKEIPYPSEYTIYKYMSQINCRLKNAVSKRVHSTNRPIACLLSGGLDSSLITALVAEHFKNDPSKLETYSIGLPESEDLKYAEIVAKHLGTNHTSIVVTEQDFFDAIPEVIYAIESYDTTTVRASVGNFLVAKYIKEHSEAKVIFNGDGSDEMTGGYLYFHKCPSSREFDLECKRLLRNIHYFDVLRSDRCISYHGLEARTPFLDRSLVEHYLTIPQDLRNHVQCKECEKYILRHSFRFQDLLPTEVLHRTKEAFSDGVSGHNKSWYETIQEHIPETDNISFEHNSPQTAEQKYYRTIFEKHFPGRGNVIPYFWMPKYTNAKDSSARTLDFYDSLVKK